MAQFVKYHYYESLSLNELFKNREAAKNAYLKEERQVMDRKEKLFKQKDISKWGLTQDQLTNIKDITSDKDKALEMMLPKVSLSSSPLGNIPPKRIPRIHVIHD